MFKKIFVIITFFIFFLNTLNSFSKNYTYTQKNSIKDLFEQAINDKAFPGGCIVAGTANQIFISECFGYHTYANEKRDTVNSLFDLASLTKVIATTSAIMKLYEEGKINLNDKVIKYLPEFKGADALQTQQKATITIKDLLAHRSGLPADSQIMEWNDIYSVPLITAPKTYEIYSDLNFLLLGKIVEKVTNEPLDVYTKQNLFLPLGMKNTMFNPPKNLLNRTIPTTFNFTTNQYLVGVVNDPLAHRLGGLAGNAGLFSDARDLTIFAQMMLNNGTYRNKQIFKPNTIHLFTARPEFRLYGSRALGWDTAFVSDSLYSKWFPAHNRIFFPPPIQFTPGLYVDSTAYGHTGYTGTSLWISPQYGIFILLLTNRVTPYICDATQTTEMYWRQRLNSAIWENLGFMHRNILEEIEKPLPRNNLSECP